MFIVDASVVAKKLWDEDYSPIVHLLFKHESFFAPDLLCVEIGNAINRRQRLKLFSSETALQTSNSLTALPITYQDSIHLLDQALLIAQHAKLNRVNDSFYLAFAAATPSEGLITADRKFYDAVMSCTELAHYHPLLIWLGDLE